MSTITIIGGTGFAGSAIVREAAERGHEVISFSRTVPAEEARVDGVRYEAGSMLDAAARSTAIVGDVVISALSPRGELDGKIIDVDLALAALAAEKGIRFGVIGGFSSLRPAEGAERFADSGDVPAEFLSEAQQMNTLLGDLLDADARVESDASLDWFFVSPAGNFGAHAPGEKLGHYRIGGDIALFDEAGNTAVSGADFATAIIDEIETPKHRRAHFSVAY
ncbi:NAD(P)H-binding protein [soil metagenome]